MREPIELQRAKNFSNHRRKNEREVELLTGNPVCPDYFCDFGKQAWAELTNLLSQLGTLSVADKPLLELYCVSYALFRRATEKTAEEGAVVESREGTEKLSPWATIGNRASATCQKILKQLGLTPASRNYLKLVKKTKLDLFMDDQP
jgi:P27 family predicted phage terminase small subunit